MTALVRRVLLGAVVEINPRRPNLARASNSPTSFVPMMAIDEASGSIRDRIVRPFSEVERGYCYFEDGDVLFAKVSPCMQNGKHAVVNGLVDGFGFGSTEFHVLRTCPDLNPQWLSHFLRQSSVLERAQATFAGSVGLQRVPTTFLQSLSIRLPSIEAQRSAVERLDAALAASRQAILAAADASSIGSALTPTLLKAAFGEQTPIAVGLTGAAGSTSTQTQPLFSLARLESGHTPSRRHPEWWGGHVPWLALPDIRKLHGKLAYKTTETINDAGLKNSSARLPPMGTVCLCRDASIGFVTMLGRPMATSQHF